MADRRLLPDPDHPGAFRVVFGEASQSWVDPSRPDYLLFEYVSHICLLIEGLLIDTDPDIRLRAVHIGGAGMSIPRWLEWRRPATAQLVCEPDAELTRQVRHKIPLPRRSGIKVRDVDGRTGVAAMPAHYADLVVVDAFDGAQVPADLVSVEFLDELTRVGRGRRVVIYNLTDIAPFSWSKRVVAGIAERWRHLLVGAEPAVFKGRRFGNLVVSGSDHRLDLAALRRATAAQAYPYRWLSGSEVRGWIGSAAPFTDANALSSPPPTGSKLWFS